LAADGLARLALAQLRFLDFVGDPARLASKLLEVLAVSGGVLRRELIAVLPDVVEASQHEVRPRVTRCDARAECGRTPAGCGGGAAGRDGRGRRHDGARARRARLAVPGRPAAGTGPLRCGTLYEASRAAQERATAAAQQLLGAARLADLPVVIRFLVQTTPPDMAADVRRAPCSCCVPLTRRSWWTRCAAAWTWAPCATPARTARARLPC
jgi:hypothetical protein